MKIKDPIRLAALVVAAALLTLAAAAATLEEMYENGVVSDGNVRFGDARDGAVSDVSKPTPGEAHRVRNGFDITMADDGGDDATGSVTGDDFGLNDDNILPGRSGAGMVFGIILAVLVILAVVVLVMLFMPKKRG